MKTELALNEYYFVCDKSGHYLKTKQLSEFQEVCNWDNLIFQEIVKTNQFIHYKIGSTWHKKSISKIKTSEPQEVGVFDFHLIQHEFSSHLSKFEIGGKEIPVTYEKL